MDLNTRFFSELMMFISLVAIYLGFAGFLGSLLFRARQRLSWPMQLLLFCLTILIVLGISLLAPWNSQWMHAQFLMVYAVILVFSLRPVRRPAWLWRTALGFRYLSLTLVLVVIWSLSGEDNSAKIILAPWAGLAAALAWQRSRELPSEEAADPKMPSQAKLETRKQDQAAPDAIQGERRSV